MEINVQVGRKPEAVFVNAATSVRRRVFIVDTPSHQNDVFLFAKFFARIAITKRAGIDNTLHRLSFTTHPVLLNDAGAEEVIAVTARVGRAFGCVDLAEPHPTSIRGVIAVPDLTDPESPSFQKDYYTVGARCAACCARRRWSGGEQVSPEVELQNSFYLYF